MDNRQLGALRFLVRLCGCDGGSGMMKKLAIEVFSEWVVTQGGVIGKPTSEWEVLRYRKADNSTGIIYRNLRDENKFSPIAGMDYKQFIRDSGLAPTKRIQRAQFAKKARLKAEVEERDGEICCYCGQFMDAPTLEHFHAIARHGTNHPDNCALACEQCNMVAGDLPVIEKMRLRDRIREAVSLLAPWEAFNAKEWAS